MTTPAALSAAPLNTFDYISQLDNCGELTDYLDFTKQVNGLYPLIPWRQGLLPDGDLVTIRTGLPAAGAAQWSEMYKGITASKGTWAHTQFKCGQLADKIEVDTRLEDIAGPAGLAVVRTREAMSMMEKLTQNLVYAMLYENSATNPSRIHGLSQYYNLSTGSTGENIIKAGGTTGNQTSIYLITRKTGFLGIVPKNGAMGLIREDRGRQDATDSTNGGTYVVNREYFKWNLGLSVPDWRQNVRICNLQIASISGYAYFELMLKAIHTLPANTNLADCVFVVPRICMYYLDALQTSKVSTGGGLTFENYQGRSVPMFRGIPVVREDQVSETEAVVS